MAIRGEPATRRAQPARGGYTSRLSPIRPMLHPASPSAGTGPAVSKPAIGSPTGQQALRASQMRHRVCPLPAWRLRRVETYIDAHLGDAIGLADLANVAGLSRMHFAAQFRIATGHRPHEFLMMRRIERAQAILRESETPLVEVALGLGFLAQAHFSTVFKKFTGATPAAWRRREHSQRGRPALN